MSFNFIPIPVKDSRLGFFTEECYRNCDNSIIEKFIELLTEVMALSKNEAVKDFAADLYTSFYNGASATGRAIKGLTDNKPT